LGWCRLDGEETRGIEAVGRAVHARVVGSEHLHPRKKTNGLNAMSPYADVDGVGAAEGWHIDFERHLVVGLTLYVEDRENDDRRMRVYEKNLPFA